MRVPFENLKIGEKMTCAKFTAFIFPAVHPPWRLGKG
jgi:hypothetical protein